MKSKRLKAITDYLSPNDYLIDVGCDHAYVSIEMAKRGCRRILATDISAKVIEIAKKNIKKENLEEKIMTKVCDGLKGVILEKYNTIVISGMGYLTIKHILEEQDLHSIKKIIVQTNNDLEDLRKYMNELGYYLEDEKIIKEKKHYYTVMKYIPKKGQILKEVEYSFGLYSKENLDYYKFIAQKLDSILKKIPNNKEQKKEVQKKRDLIKEYLEKETGSI